MEQINRCLHCGGIGEVTGRKKIKVTCKTCGASGAEMPLRSQAIASWNKSNIVHCEHCEFYHADIGWCDKLSYFYDENEQPVPPSESDVWLVFDKDDYCSRGKKREPENGRR